VGETTVTCTAKDAAGNKSECTFTVTVVDQQAPTLTCKDATITLDANGNASISESDVVDSKSDDCRTVIVQLSRTSFTCADLGEQTVTITASDGNNSTTCQAKVTVVEKTPPSLSCPGNQTFNATAPNGATVNYSAATASDNCGGSVTITYSKNTGTLFPIGDTTVTVNAADASGNRATSCSFKVHVKGAVEQINDLIVRVNDIAGTKSPNKTALIAKLQAALAALAKNDSATACARMQDFINLVKAQKDKKVIKASDADALTADGLRIRLGIGCP